MTPQCRPLAGMKIIRNRSVAGGCFFGIFGKMAGSERFSLPIPSPATLPSAIEAAPSAFGSVQQAPLSGLGRHAVAAELPPLGPVWGKGRECFAESRATAGALSDRLSDKHVARLVQYLALTVISAAASAST
jgi:hypothetical protein